MPYGVGAIVCNLPKNSIDMKSSTVVESASEYNKADRQYYLQTM